MKEIILKIVRKLNKFVLGGLEERFFIERLVRDKRIYNALEIPDKCFKSESSSLIKLWKLIMQVN